MLNSQSIVGFKKTGREVNDFYPSPEHTIYDLVKFEDFSNGLIWEPACGNGAMSKPLMKIYGKQNVYSSDLIYRNYGVGNIDFLTYELKGKKRPRYIITNPPYKCAKQFVIRALEVVSNNGKVAMLLKLVFLESSNRYKLFKNSPLKSVLAYCKRLKIYKNGKMGKNSGLIAYAWFIWDKTYKGKPTIDWIQ